MPVSAVADIRHVLTEQLLALEVCIEDIFVAAIHRSRILNGLIAISVGGATGVEHSGPDGNLQQLGILGACQARLQLLVGLDEWHSKLW